MIDDSVRASGTVIVPAFNEAGNIGISLPKIAEVLRRDLADRKWEIVVVDDGSSDGTAAEAQAAALHPACSGISVRVLRHLINRGLGGALQTAFGASTGNVVVVVDCDLSYSPAHIPRLVTALLSNHAQVAIASPYMDGGSTIGVPRHIERRSRAANSFLSAAVNGQIATLTGMVRAYDGEFIRGLALNSLDTEINIEAIYKTRILRGRVVEIPATLDWSGMETRASRTRMSNPRTRSRMYNTVLDGVLFRPYVLFGIAGMVLVGLGTAFGVIAVVLPGSQNGFTVLGICALTTGLMLCFAGLLSVQIKRCFEELFFLGSPKVGNAAVGVTEHTSDGSPAVRTIDVIPRPTPSSIR